MSSERFWTKSYDPHVKPTLEYPNEGLGSLLLKSISEFPDKVGGYFMNYAMSFREMKKLAERFASYLQKNGIGKGDVVAINVPNTPQFNIAHIGTQLIGAVSSGCSPLLSAEEIAYQLNDSNAKVIVTLDIIYAKVLRTILDKVPNLEIIIPIDISTYMGFSKFKVFLGKLLKKIPSGKVKPWPGKIVTKFQDVVKTPIDYHMPQINPDEDLCVLQYTGGTTGRPKGTELTHLNIISNMVQFNNWLNLQRGSGVTLSAFPYFHIAGLLVVDQSLYMAFSQVLIANPRDTDHLIDELITKKPTIVANVPTLYNMIINNPKHKKIPKEILDNIVAYVSGAAPFPVESIREFEKAMQAENKVLEVYGMTEASPLLSANPMIGKKKIGSVGLPFPDTDIRLINLDTGEPVTKIGERGEIVCKGPQVTHGYHNKPKATKKTIIDGWFYTGDVGVFDEDGYLTIVDRVKDMINVSGYKVYSVHVEDILTKHPDIELCALIGIKDPNRPGSEIVKAFIKLKEGIEATNTVKESIKMYAAENLSKYENPKIWEFRDELPLTTVGKVLKRDLRDS
ncbi:MAG: AMP-binding protein [Candidatus Helarchaeota archaeon]